MWLPDSAGSCWWIENHLQFATLGSFLAGRINPIWQILVYHLWWVIRIMLLLGCNILVSWEASGEDEEGTRKQLLLFARVPLRCLCQFCAEKRSFYSGQFIVAWTPVSFALISIQSSCNTAHESFTDRVIIIPVKIFFICHWQWELADLIMFKNSSLSATL